MHRRDTVLTVPISVMIFTLNEEVNLPHCLASLSWADDIIVIDSGSSDRTIEIAEQGGARVFTHPFEGFGSQRNWALNNSQPRHEWVLILDADERVPDELAIEIGGRLETVDQEVSAFRVRRRFYMWGRWLRWSSLYPSWLVRLVRVNRVEFINRGHAETQQMEGKLVDLREDLLDENHKGLESWFDRQNRYSTQDAEYESNVARRPGWWKDLWADDPLARRTAAKTLSFALPFRSSIYFLYSYFLRGGFLDGVPGFWFCLMRAHYQFMVSAKKKDLRHRAYKETQ